VSQSLDTRYDATTILFHWATAILVVVQWLGAQTIDWFPSGAFRVDARSVHIVGGVLLTFLLLARILWRIRRGRHLPPQPGHQALDLVAKAAHWGLYALMLAMVTVGMVLTWVRGDSIFGVFQIPAYDPGNHALADQIQDLHGTIGWIILGLAGLHAASALVHRYVWKDGVLERMLPSA
jgi:cytochrome b561